MMTLSENHQPNGVNYSQVAMLRMVGLLLLWIEKKKLYLAVDWNPNRGGDRAEVESEMMVRSVGIYWRDSMVVVDWIGVVEVVVVDELGNREGLIFSVGAVLRDLILAA